MTWTRSSFQSSPGPTFANTYGGTICKRRRQELFPANKWENFVGMEEVEGNLKKLFAALQANLRSIGYTVEESAFDRVANLLNTTTNNCTSSDCNQPLYKLKFDIWTLNPLYRIFLWLLLGSLIFVFQGFSQFELVKECKLTYPPFWFV